MTLVLLDTYADPLLLEEDINTAFSMFGGNVE
jgi:hypothetical protein